LFFYYFIVHGTCVGTYVINPSGAGVDTWVSNPGGTWVGTCAINPSGTLGTTYVVEVLEASLVTPHGADDKLEAVGHLSHSPQAEGQATPTGLEHRAIQVPAPLN